MRIGRVSTSQGPTLVQQDSDGSFRAIAEPGVSLYQLLSGDVAPRPSAEPLASPSLLTPYSPGKIVAIGLNYLDHIRETGMEVPAAPLVFAKFTSSVVGHGADIVFDPGLTQRVDWEVELGVVVGRRARNVDEADALDHVYGYTAANDVSARDVQFADGQWVRGKSMDTFCPIGPVVVTADEIPDPQRLRLGTRVNGTTVQDSTTAEMLFGAAELISYCSANFTLDPGDLILTGTPWGCGEFMDPRRSLREGDEVEVWVEGIGSVTNTVRCVRTDVTSAGDGVSVAGQRPSG
jgi:2-keto-4-pentenoate hydratase/2-oxohepta-3-ene-1,7-dioic acid hydratase in catechol pathway